MFRKIKRYFVDNIESAKEDIAVTIASLLYDIAREDGMDVLNYGRVFVTNWAKGKKNGLDITFGAISAVTDDQSTIYSFMSVNIEKELNSKFNNSAIANFKARGALAFSNVCTFLVVNALNEHREQSFNQEYALFHIPKTQPAARGESKAYSDAVKARNNKEQARLVRLSTNGPEKHLYIKPSLTIGQAAADEVKLRESKLKFETYEHYTGLIR